MILKMAIINENINWNYLVNNINSHFDNINPSKNQMIGNTIK